MEQARNQSLRGTGFNLWGSRSEEGSSSQKRQSGAKHIPSTDGNPSKKIKLNIRTVKSTTREGDIVHTGTEIDYSAGAGNKAAKQDNTGLAVQNLQRADWQNFNWTDERVYTYFAAQHIGSARYLELVKEGGFQAFQKLTKELTENVATDISEEYQGQLHIMQVLAAIFAQQGPHGTQIPKEAKKLLDSYKHLTPDVWPNTSDIDICSKENEFQKLLKSLTDFASFGHILTMHLDNPYGIAHAIVDRKLTAQKSGWQGGAIPETEIDNRVSVQKLLSHFKDQAAGAALFHLLTIDPNIYDEELNVQEEQWLRQELAKYFGKNWATSLKDLQETVACFCIGYLHINPLQYTHHSSESHARPVTYTAGPSSSRQITRTQAVKKAIEHNRLKFAKLPWDDAFFMVALSHCFMGNQKDTLKSKLTVACKGEYFVDHVLMPQIESGDFTVYDQFLTVLEKCEYPYVKTTANKLIKAEAEAEAEAETETETDYDFSQYHSNPDQVERIYTRCAVELLEWLHCDDPKFYRILEKNGLFPGNSGPTMASKLTRLDKNDYFIGLLKRGTSPELFYQALKESSDEFPSHGRLLEFFRRK